jgi:hypothetical protein
VQGKFKVSEVGPWGKLPKCGENSEFPKLGHERNRPSVGKIRGFRSWAAGETAQVRGKFGVSEAGPWGKPPNCGENSGFPKLGHEGNRPSVGKIQGFRSWATGETTQVWGKFGVSEAGSWEKLPKCGENSGFPKLGHGGNHPSARKIQGFRSWATGETAQVRGKFGVSEAGPRGKPPKCGENSGFPKLGRGGNHPSGGEIRGFRSWAAGETAQVRGKFRVSEAGPREKPPKCGVNLGFSGPTESEFSAQACGEIQVFQADRERIHRPSVWGNSRFLGRSREKLPKCRESRVSTSGWVTDAAHV